MFLQRNLRCTNTHIFICIVHLWDLDVYASKVTTLWRYTNMLIIIIIIIIIIDNYSRIAVIIRLFVFQSERENSCPRFFPKRLFLASLICEFLSTLGCSPTWASQDDTHGQNGVATSASTVEECRSLCSYNGSCTAIDWNGAASNGPRCFLHGSWSGGSTSATTGVQHHTITRTCGLRSMCICVVIIVIMIITYVNLCSTHLPLLQVIQPARGATKLSGWLRK